MKKKSLQLLIATALVAACLTACSTPAATDLTKNNIIPRPVSVTATGDLFTLNTKSDIFIMPDAPAEIISIANYLADQLRPSTGLPLKVITGGKPGRGDIMLTLNSNNGELGDEGYELVITSKFLTITAGKPDGVFRAVQTIRQLLPPEVEAETAQSVSWAIPTGTIRDFPEYEYRGAMLDVARHFFPPEAVKRYIDQLALYKMNVLHLHLTDDQGWRIEIKSWPNLTEHGAKTAVGGGAGGFFTQDEYADIVKYAEERYITIIPEIDMPSHTNAAISSYPELNVGGRPTELYTGTAVGFSSFNTRSETTYKFIDDVIGELVALTPGPYFHIGGDESHATKMPDYIYFVDRVIEIVRKHGKKILGWDEIAHAEVGGDVTIQYWARDANAVMGIEKGAKVLAAPAKHAYIDQKYDRTTKLGLSWAAFNEVDQAYNWDPATLTPAIARENIVGIEAPLWAETISTFTEAEYLIYPRLPGHAEIGWTPSALRSWDEYRTRLAAHGKRMEIMGINFYRSPRVDWDGSVERDEE